MTVRGYTLPGGMIYVGGAIESVTGHSVEPALIDPSLPVARNRPDRVGKGMSHWPSYAGIPAECRAGQEVASADLVLSISNAGPEQVRDPLKAIATEGTVDGVSLALDVGSRRTNKYDEFLSQEFLAADYAARELDPAGAWEFVRRLVEGGFRPPLPCSEDGIA